MIFIGVDVGIKGAISLMDEKGKIMTVMTYPTKEIIMSKTKTKKTTLIDVAALRATLLPWLNGSKKDEVHVIMERIFVNPRARGISGITAGINYGRLWGALELISNNIHIESPRSWQKELLKENKVITGIDTKNLSIAVTEKLYGRDIMMTKGARVPKDGIADAILLARYLRNQVLNLKE